MPFYDGLKIRAVDNAAVKADKKRISANLLRLRDALKSRIRGQRGTDDAVAETSRTMRLATWNLREFDNDKYGNRLTESYYYIAEIVSQFDLGAVQEVREDLSALGRVMDILGPDWDYIATDVSPGTRGNRERMVFLFSRRKVWFRKVAGELTLADKDRLQLPGSFHLVSPEGAAITLPPGSDLAPLAEVDTKRSRGKPKIETAALVDLPAGTQLRLPAGCQLAFGPGTTPELRDDGTLDLKAGTVREFSKASSIRIPLKALKADEMQFARTPFAVAFQAGWLKLMLCTVHIYYGADKGPKLARRNAEIRTLTKALADRARDEKDSDADSFFFVLGDFNIVGKNHATWEALHENDFRVPDEIREIPAGSNVKRDKAYDQIAVWERTSRKRREFKTYTSVDVHCAGVFDFFKTVFRKGGDDPGGDDQAVYEKIIAAEQPRFQKPLKKPWAYGTWRTYQMSGHLPMWVELRIDFGDDYLQGIVDTA